MFDSYYDFHFYGCQILLSQAPFQELIYKFKTTNRKYVVILEEYPDSVFSIKFFERKEKNNPQKYNAVLNDGIPFKILRTVINIMIDVLKKKYKASFGFIGAESISKKESKSNTQRFRIYNYISINYFGEESFMHLTDAQNSAYILINKKNTEPYEIAKKAVTMFAEIYPRLESLRNCYF